MFSYTDFTDIWTSSETDDMKKGPSDDVIEFVCQKDLYGAMPEPKPANKVLPNWYKQLDQRMGEGLGESTVKRCAPFLDAMTSGWIIPLAGEVEMDVPEGDVNWNFQKTLIGKHHPEQLGGEERLDGVPIKFNNYWGIKVPDGYSVLFVAPLNRTENRFSVFSGMVDCDNYPLYINFPALINEDYKGVLDAGTPLVQAIPIKRETLISDGKTRPMTKEEKLEMSRDNNRLASRESMYREERWAAKRGSRMVDSDNTE